MLCYDYSVWCNRYSSVPLSSLQFKHGVDGGGGGASFWQNFQISCSLFHQQELNQKPIQNPVKHLKGSFFIIIVTVSSL